MIHATWYKVNKMCDGDDGDIILEHNALRIRRSFPTAAGPCKHVDDSIGEAIAPNEEHSFQGGNDFNEDLNGKVVAPIWTINE